MSTANGPYSVYTAAPEIYDELPHEAVTYGDPYVKLVVGVEIAYRVKTVTATYRLRRPFLTKEACETGITALQSAFDAIGAALTPARSIATVTGTLGYDGLAYDLIVNYANAVSVEEAVP